jgi:hypothetical protein
MDDDTENTGAPDAANATGGLSVYDPAAIRSKLAEYTDLSNSQKAYYDKLREEILARRAGPSASERLYQLGAALMAPTSVRGFSGTMNNVLPVLQQQAKDVREGKENRADALSKLEQAQLAARQGLLGQEINTQVALARIAAAKGKRRTGFNPVTGELVDLDTNQPIQDESIPVMTPEQVAAMARDPRNKGTKFRTTDGRVMEIK